MLIARHVAASSVISSNSTCSICLHSCGFAVQLVLQQIHSKSTTNPQLFDKSTTFRCRELAGTWTVGRPNRGPLGMHVICEQLLNCGPATGGFHSAKLRILPALADPAIQSGGIPCETGARRTGAIACFSRVGLALFSKTGVEIDSAASKGGLLLKGQNSRWYR
jgi:hypothetical protein